MRSIVLDCPDPLRLAEFYSRLLGWEITSVEDEWVVVTDGHAPRVCLQKVEDYRPPVWPGADRPQQLHIDVTVDDPDLAEAQVLELGAVKAAFQPGEKDGGFRVFLDPAGHPFCLCYDLPLLRLTY
jgi:predicted enzyme related to lactoylglutathione lyase